MKSSAKTVKQYLDELPQDRLEPIQEVREVILNNLPDGYKEGMQYGMIGYYVPIKLYPKGYLNDGKTGLPYAALASQKNHMAIYLMSVYANKEGYEQFKEEYKKTGKKMDIGKSCVRFTKIENVPLPLIGKTIANTSVKDFIKLYEDSRKNR